MPVAVAISLHDDLLCGGCRQNLRGVPDGRCPECGRPFRRGALLSDRIPWEQRREIGRIRAYVRTLWLVSCRPEQLMRYADQPVDDAAARSFQWVTLYLTFSAFSASVVAIHPAWSRMTEGLQTPPSIWSTAWARSPERLLATLAWMFTDPVIRITCVVAGMLWVWAVTHTAARGLVGRVNADARRARAAAIACYALSPFPLVTWAAVSVATLALSPLAGVPLGDKSSPQPGWELIAGGLLACGVPVAWLMRRAQHLRPLTGRSAARQRARALAVTLAAATWAVVIGAGTHFVVTYALILWSCW